MALSAVQTGIREEYMRKDLSAAVLLIYFVLLPSTVFAKNGAESFTGSGTHNDPYLIENVSDLMEFETEVNSGKHFHGIYFLQTENIDLSEIEWTPVGLFGTEYSFDGIYDGGGEYDK